MATIYTRFTIVFLLFNTTFCVEELDGVYSLADPYYVMTYLQLVDEMQSSSVLRCASESLRQSVTAFGYRKQDKMCRLFTVDYWMTFSWQTTPGLKIYLREHADDCLPEPCSFCMLVLNPRVPWSSASASCDDSAYGLLELNSDWIRQCVIVHLQHLRRPTLTSYWIGINLPTQASEWFSNVTGQGQASGSGSGGGVSPEACLLLRPRANYSVYSVDCSEKHSVLCFYSPNYSSNYYISLG